MLRTPPRPPLMQAAQTPCDPRLKQQYSHSSWPGPTHLLALAAAYIFPIRLVRGSTLESYTDSRKNKGR